MCCANMILCCCAVYIDLKKKIKHTCLVSQNRNEYFCLLTFAKFTISIIFIAKDTNKTLFQLQARRGWNDETWLCCLTEKHPVFLA